MATSKTPRRKAAPDTETAPAEQAPVKKKPAAKAAKADKAPKAEKAVKAQKAEQAEKAVPAAKAGRAAKGAAQAEAPVVKKAATKVATKVAKKTAEKATGKAAAKTASKPARKAVAKPVEPVELVAEPAVKRGRKAAPAAEAPVEAPAKPAARSRKAAVAAEAPVAPEAEAAKPARKTRKSGTPAVAAPVAALVAEVAAALEQPSAPAPRKRASGRGKAADVAAAQVPVELPPEAVEEAPAKPARKPRPSRKTQAGPAPEVLAGERDEEPSEPSAEDAPSAAEPRKRGPDWRWHKPQPGLFGSYALQDADGAPLATLDLQGGVGHYRCSCEEFQDSEEGACAHGQWLIEQLSAAREGQDRKLAAGPDTPWSELGLSAGWERRLVWRLGQGASPALRALAEDYADEQGRFIAPLEGQVLPALLQAAAAEGHELRVGAEVWQQLALSADAGDRVERLAQAFEQGLASPALHALVRVPLPELQWEAALFAVCAGRALLADESPLPQRPSAIVAAQLWQSRFDLGAVAIVAPSALHEAWRADVGRLLGAWPAGWSLLSPADLAPAAGCELLVVDAVDTLGDALPALRRLGAPQLILLAHRELLGGDLLAPVVAWIDEARRGPYARLRRLGAEAGKRQQREALETVMLARRRRDLAAGLPAQLLTHWVRVPTQDCAGLTLDASALQGLQRLHQRWSRTGSLSAGEQLQLQQALLTLRTGDAASAERMGEARAAALVRLLPELVPGRAERVVVFARQDAALRPLALALQDLGLPLANLRQHQSAEVRALELQAWAEGEASVLLATDAACAGLDLRQPGSVVVHADLSWNPALMSQRLERLATEGAGVSAWALVLEAGFDPAQLAAHAQETSLPAGLQDGEAGAIPFLAGSDLQAFMDALGRALAALSAA